MSTSDSQGQFLVKFGATAAAFGVLLYLRVKKTLSSKENCLATQFQLTKPADWKYIAEGALNLTLKYVGEDSALKGYVLRLRKNNPKASGGKRSADPWTESTAYGEKIMLPLLGRRYVQPSHKVPVTESFIKAVDASILNSRPVKRRKYPLDDRLRYGLLMVDNTCLNGIHKGPAMCVELKVKCGFIPTSPWVSHDVKKRVDRFQMHQQLKVKEGKLDSVSKYSPPALFSREPKKVQCAIDDLLETPQNNFRLFVDGKMMFPDSKGHGSKEQLKRILSEYPEIPGGADGFINALINLLVYEPLLDRIRTAQEFDEADIEAVWPVYQEIARRGEKILPLAEGDTLYPRKPHRTLPKTPEEQHELVRRFLVSCTAKDCSVMIVIQPDGSPSNSRKTREKLTDLPIKVGKDVPRTVVSEFDGFSYSVAIVDLDPKPLEKMEHYYKLDKEIAEYYSKLESTKSLR